MNFYITDFEFSIYSFFIFLSLALATTFVYINLKRNKIPQNIIVLSLLSNGYFIIIGAKLFTLLTSKKEGLTLLTAGFSSYGGAIGMILSLIIFCQIYNKDRDIFFKTYFLTIPLLYSISKLGCFFAGCCIGIPYDGVFHVNYNTSYKIATAFPVQLLETISFMIIFLICFKMYKDKNKNYSNELLFLFCAVAKFVLDFFRESHVGIILSVNQIVSILFCIYALSSIVLKNIKLRKNNTIKI